MLNMEKKTRIEFLKIIREEKKWHEGLVLKIDQIFSEAKETTPEKREIMIGLKLDLSEADLKLPKFITSEEVVKDLENSLENLPSSTPIVIPNKTQTYRPFETSAQSEINYSNFEIFENFFIHISKAGALRNHYLKILANFLKGKEEKEFLSIFFKNFFSSKQNQNEIPDSNTFFSIFYISNLYTKLLSIEKDWANLTKFLKIIQPVYHCFLGSSNPKARKAYIRDGLRHQKCFKSEDFWVGVIRYLIQESM